MAKHGAYRPVFSEGTTEFLLKLPKRGRREVLSTIRQLAEHPFVRSDYSLPDEAGRPIEHILINDYVFSYWLDHAVREIRITDIEDAT